MFDSKGSLNVNRKDIEDDKRFYHKWEICLKTNPKIINTMEEAMKDADVLISLSTPGPDTVKKEWISLMAKKSIVFACANPVPEIYPYAAKRSRELILLPQEEAIFLIKVNNSIGFPGILKGALMVRAKKITDNMAIAAAHSLADYAEKRGISIEDIVPNMNEAEVFPQEAADVAMQAIKDGVARVIITREEAFNKAKADIEYSRSMVKTLTDEGFINEPPQQMLDEALAWAIEQI